MRERKKNIFYGRIIVVVIGIIILSGCTEKADPRTATEIVKIYTVEYTREDNFEDIYFTCNSSINEGKIENRFSIVLTSGDIVQLSWVEKAYKHPLNPFPNSTTYSWVLQSITDIGE